MFALLQHLYISMFIQNEDFYARYVWPLNMYIIGLASIAVFSDKSKQEIYIKNILVFLSIVLPILMPFFDIVEVIFWLKVVSAIYTIYFMYLLYEMMKDLFGPDEVDKNVILAAGCGFLLLIEIFTFTLQFFYYDNPQILKGMNASSFISVFTDLVYFSTVSVTTIGYGDITPNTQNIKLYAAFMGLLSQFYNVLIVGVLVSKFTFLGGKNKSDGEGEQGS